MKTIKATHVSETPKNFTGIVEFSSGTKCWFKDGKFHREDGPAIEYPNGVSYFYFEDKGYNEINLKDYVVLDHYQGKYGIMRYKLLAEDGIIEYPDIPGLIIK